jgi:hypothetical protein
VPNGNASIGLSNLTSFQFSDTITGLNPGDTVTTQANYSLANLSSFTYTLNGTSPSLSFLTNPVSTSITDPRYGDSTSLGFFQVVSNIGNDYIPAGTYGSTIVYHNELITTGAVTISAPVTPPHIYFASPTGTIDVTNTTQTVVVGQSIQLTAEPAGQPISWSVPGQTIGSYTPTSSSFQTAEVVPTSLGPNSSADFYWITSGTNTVIYSSQAGLAQATFIVKPAPKPTVTVTYGKPEPAWIYTKNGKQHMSFGSLFAPADPGILLQTKTNPGSGRFEWIQLIQSDISIYIGGSGATCQDSGGLDAGIVGYPSEIGGKFDDTPSVVLISPYTQVKRSFIADTYLMWQSTIQNSIPVPLGTVTWGFDEMSLFYNNAWTTPTATEQSATFAPNLQQYPVWQSVSNVECK